MLESFSFEVTLAASAEESMGSPLRHRVMLGGQAVRRQVVLHFGAGERAVALNVSLYVPAKAAKPAPVVLRIYRVWLHPLPTCR